MRNAARVFATLGFVGVCAIIFYLTVQGPAESVALSGRFDELMKALLAHLGTEGVGGALARVAQAVPVRRIGHAGEFFIFGIMASLLVVAWFSNKMNTPSMMLASFSLCVAGSFFDQIHKIFVPVRHFDWKDLPFDACGYLTAIAVTFACYGVIRALAKRSES